MELTTQVKTEQKQILGQAQIQSLEILAMDTLELESFLQNEYMNNPLLEHTSNQEMHSSVEAYTAAYVNPYTGSNYIFDKEDERDEGRTFVAPNRDYLKDYITSQLDIQHFSKREWRLIQFLIDCLEDDGFFKMEVEEVCKLTGEKRETVKEMLAVLRDLEPYGIFSGNLQDCLIKQLEMMGIQNSELNLMISDYLKEISEGRISVISRNLNLSTAQVRKYIAIISKLNPKPLSGLQGSEVSYIVPDIIFDKKEHEWEVQINDNWFGEYSINDYYVKMMQSTKDTELLAYFHKKLERSRFLMQSIEQRRETIRKISETIVKKQKDYFEGKCPLKPMTMAEVADELGIHPSTVTRAVKGKYLQYPRGTMLMKNLFSTVVSSEKGNEWSASNIKERIKEMIDGEDKKKPLSDAKITELLKKEGIQVSRRAVAKYREEMWIKSSFERKRVE